MLDRRTLLRTGLAFVSAPAIMRVAPIMPIKAFSPPWLPMQVDFDMANLDFSYTLHELVDLHNNMRSMIARKAVRDKLAELLSHVA